VVERVLESGHCCCDVLWRVGKRDAGDVGGSL
jgi:hypothetical protein